MIAGSNLGGMGLFSSGPSFSDHTNRLLDIVADSSNDAKRRDALDKLARQEDGDTALAYVVVDKSLHNGDHFIREEAIEKMEYMRAEEELDKLIDDNIDDEYKVAAIEALGSIGATDKLGDIAHHFDGKNETLSRKVFQYL
jgi:hypothetical protein